MASAFEGPARTAFLTGIVRAETFANAVTVNNIFQKLGSVVGPGLGGVIIAALGITAGYVTFCIALAIAALPLLILKYEWTPARGQRVSLKAMREGIAFVRRNQVLYGAMSLDMFAVIFGGATALLPIYAKDILQAGATGFGLLTSSMQIGAFGMSFLLVAFPPVRRTGRVLVLSVVAFGLLTIGFGLSRDLYLSLVLYGLIGAADQISVVMRQTTIQLATPDELRGRVSSVNQVFVQASGQVGAIEHSFVAALTTATFAVVSGGIGATLIAGLVGWRMPLLYRHEQGSMPQQVGPAASAPGSRRDAPDREEEPVSAGGS
jgi:MFS family permease